MKVSIVTISFNQARFLEHGIRSVISQGYDDLEYIVVDPGSTDGSREIINRYQDRISKIIFEPDNGPADGLNKGFRNSTGDVLAFVNADDFLLSGALTKVAHVFSNSPDIDVVYGNGYVINAENRILRRIVADPFNLRRFLHGCVTFIQPSMFIRRDAFFSVGGFNVDNKTCWDAELLAELGKTGKKIVRLNAYLSAFRIHDSSISGSGRMRERYLADWERIFRRISGRPRGWHDTLFRIAARLEKWALNPAGLAIHIFDKLYPQAIRTLSSDLLKSMSEAYQQVRNADE
jgi:glycosyltransferase involved in cell wall biosynthesis